MPFCAPSSAARLIATNVAVRSASEPGIVAIAALTSARNAFWSPAERCCMIAFITTGLAIALSMRPFASASEMRALFAFRRAAVPSAAPKHVAPASRAAATINRFFIVVCLLN